jgi:hypothetical protein
MASIRSIYIFNTDNKMLFSRTFPTIENRLKKQMGEDYIEIPLEDKIIRNAFYNKVIREELLQEEFKVMTYKEDLEIDHQKMSELIKAVDINLNIKNFKHYSECPIVSLDIGNNKVLWPCIYIRKFKLYGVVFPNIDYIKYKSIKSEILKDSLGKEIQENDIIFRIKSLYEEQDISIVGSFTLIENLLNYVISSKNYEENKLQTLISNMVPFGNIIETNINFMLESLNFLNQRFISNSNIFSHFLDSGKKNITKTSTEVHEKKKIPGWVTKIPTNSSEKLSITIKEELKFVKYGQDKIYNIILCDLNCLAELSRNCEITIPLKEVGLANYLGNLRIHPCAKLEDQNLINDATRIIFIPPHDEFKLGVFEIENIHQNSLPIIGNFSLKELGQFEVKIYLTVRIDETAIGKFDYFYINIPLGHYGSIVDTKIMVQVGEVTLLNNKTILHWDLQNKVFDNNIVLSGTVYYQKKNVKESKVSSESYKHLENESDSSKLDEAKYSKKVSSIETNGGTINIEDMLKTKIRPSSSSDIMSTNCYCKIHFKLNNYFLSNLEIDKKSFHFYPKLSPRIDIKQQFFSNDYIIWNSLSFNNNDVNIPEKPQNHLLNINIDED